MPTLTVTGEAYHSKKAKFKKLLKELDCRWCGTMEQVEWRSSGIRITGIYDRDEVNNLTIKATLDIEGDDTEGIQKLVSFLRSEMNAVGDVAKEMQSRVTEYEMWETIYQPVFESSAPGFVVAKQKKEWARRQKMEMLRIGVTTAMIQGVLPDALPTPLPDIELEPIIDEGPSTGITEEDVIWAKKCQEREKKMEARKRLSKKTKFNAPPDADAIGNDILKRTGHLENKSKKVEMSSAKSNLLSKLKSIRSKSNPKSDSKSESSVSQEGE